MFWKYNNNSSSELDALLAKQDVTLSEVMDAEDIINQCKAQSKGLIDFLLKPEMMEELVSLVTREPSNELDERVRFKYPNIACELLTSDVPSINERLASDEVLLDKLYSFLECEPPLNPLLASYFSRIMGALIARKTEQNWLSYQFTCLQVLDFLKTKDTFISLLLKHLGTSAIMDLMLKLMTQVESLEMRQNILNWLDSQRIMQSLVCLLNPKIDKERHYNVAQLLCDFIKAARDTQRNSSERVDPDPLLNTLESAETVSLLLDNIFQEEKTESAIVGGIQVLLALLDISQLSIPKINSQISYNSNINDEAIDIEHKEKVIKSTTEAILGHIKDFHELLINPPIKSSINTSVGILETPLGNTRLQVTKLFAAIIASNNTRLAEEIVSMDTFSILLDLFFKYPWNNFLHTQVENCLISALKTHTTDESNENSNALSTHLLVKCNVIERILKAWKDNDEQQKANGVRQGYMGHLISIINKVVELCSNTSLGKYLIDNLPEVAKNLDEFKETTLKETNSVQDTLLGGVYPHSTHEDSNDYPGVTYNQNEIYCSYQTHNLTPHCIDGYSGFNDDEFNDGDDTLQSIDHRTDMNFSLTDGDLAQQRELFKQMCAQNINTLDDADDQIFEDRDHTFQTVIEKEDQNDTVYSSDSDDDNGPAGVPMDVDRGTGAPLEAADPWGGAPQSTTTTTTTTTSDQMGDWADFSSVNFEANFEAVFEKTPTRKSDDDDLKVENIEEFEAKKTDDVISIETVAQTAIKDDQNVEKKEEKQAGDLLLGERKDTSQSVIEPSNASVHVEGVKEALPPASETKDV
ncbi:serine/threonine-protein phosphatase 6 regulatory subunit 3 isoform X2 [Tribolium castaneum]|uniref:serine/threonine-protein phosphatase 6 regulatory subunit 3 isoform X2 n=1 Tax=Tribolium castaneum TaxID=7070 RepID=UPI00046C159F|nr:PREDICTED: serine/threonine-protein phosphatase 6 regulatory subunit 3 isoform X2 [Tribolium castaneum]|eukprot:XP_008200387.1 PREDICTED: serine/threonine-protein phosphatase 6 regulatory subunit 3 isoform X2 [Tribolium castaneum]